MEYEKKDIVLTINCVIPKGVETKWIKDHLEFCLGISAQIDQDEENPLRSTLVGEIVSDIEKMTIKRKKYL